MKKPQLLLIALAIFSTSLTTAKTASFTWQDELCEFKGQYNNQKYSEQQLKDTLSMLQLRHGVQLHSHSYAFQPQDIAKIHLPAIHQEYRQQKKIPTWFTACCIARISTTQKTFAAKFRTRA